MSSFAASAEFWVFTVPFDATMPDSEDDPHMFIADPRDGLKCRIFLAHHVFVFNVFLHALDLLAIEFPMQSS